MVSLQEKPKQHTQSYSSPKTLKLLQSRGLLLPHIILFPNAHNYLTVTICTRWPFIFAETFISSKKYSLHFLRFIIRSKICTDKHTPNKSWPLQSINRNIYQHITLSTPSTILSNRQLSSYLEPTKVICMVTEFMLSSSDFRQTVWVDLKWYNVQQKRCMWWTRDSCLVASGIILYGSCSASDVSYLTLKRKIFREEV